MQLGRVASCNDDALRLKLCPVKQILDRAIIIFYLKYSHTAAGMLVGMTTRNVKTHL